MSTRIYTWIPMYGCYMNLYIVLDYQENSIEMKSKKPFSDTMADLIKIINRYKEINDGKL